MVYLLLTKNIGSKIPELRPAELTAVSTVRPDRRGLVVNADMLNVGRLALNWNVSMDELLDRVIQS